MLAVLLSFLFALPFCMVAYYTSIPASFPRNIPVVSIQLQIYDALCGVSRVHNFNSRIRPPIEKHGAVGLWRHGQWIVLTTKPAYLVQLFKKTDGTLTKFGAYHRHPGSLNARFFGETIFNSERELHSTFSKILKPGMLRPVPIKSIQARSVELATTLLRGQMSEQSGISIRTSVWTWAVSLYGEYFLDTKIHSLEFSRSSMQQILRTLNRSVVGRLVNANGWAMFKYTM
jgi:unspecific monooxygenase